ncbi:MAG: pyridoxamine 5'-phosphate oxidase [Gammaproteobacteria bacterium]|nr:pyridoxamine 5'-phosphate oxidase [Gammaproteobacteria bacterium]
MQLEELRREYLQGGLERADLDDDPLVQFERWLAQAMQLGVNDPTAMTVATVDAQGQPSQRVVLLKHVDNNGFVFYTNLDSRKALELGTNPKTSLHFPWHQIDRQVKVRGVAERIPAAVALAYFASRPRESQLAAWASAQSRPISSRQFLLQQFAAMKKRFSEGHIPLPDRWGGYRVVPHAIEFWQGGAHRLHDRFEFVKSTGADWSVARLAP